ncbi:IS110 family transposase [Zooshikella ganghwensis]|uniref:IS110 family transposase n=1 Tax=Zooshikella ganghwensis TaxID=202772 RepID=UPI00197E3F59|nr:transposase [Zooshikella ganghwensis]
MSNKSKHAQSLPVLNSNAAGIDIGASFHVVALPPDRSSESVHTFKAFTSDIQSMANWLLENGITTAAMESTGVYWVPVYEILEQHGIDVILSNARDTRSVPGRKTELSGSSGYMLVDF